MLKIGWKNCPYCGDPEVYRSRSEPLMWLERSCGFFLLQLVRCHECEERHYRPIFFPAPEFPRPVSAEKRGPARADEDEEKKRSA
jgi:hypothetical protein